MHCPICLQSIHQSATRCPHCEADATNLYALYDGCSEKIPLLNDTAGVLNIPQRRKVERWIKHFAKEFPNNFLTVHLVSLADQQSVKSYGIWALNKPTYLNQSETASPDAGICLTIDVKKKEVNLSYGYQLEPHLTPIQCFHAISPAHPFLIDSAYIESIQFMRHGIRKLLRSRIRKSKSTLKKQGLLQRIIR